MNSRKDATGHAVFDAWNKKYGFEVVEREDGYVVGGDTAQYFDDFKKWHPHEKKAIKRAKGKILDIGCGAGRHSLYLQSKGLGVTGIEISPLLVEVCKKRGMKDVKLLSIDKIDGLDRCFDTILLLGNNFGLLRNFDKARQLLRKMRRITADGSVIIAESADPYRTTEEANLKYQRSNLKRGRMAGQRKIRIRYRNYASDWTDYLGVSPKEMERILEGTGWKIVKIFDSERSSYIAIIEKS